MPHLAFPLLLGHRGAPHDAPENTIASFREAVMQGAHGVELDVQRSADGVPIVIHDDSLERTTDGTGFVSALRREQLGEVRAGGEPVPSLGDAVDWAREAGAFLNVEIKAALLEEAAIAIVERAGLLDRTIFSSFDSGIVHEVGRLAPHAHRYLLRERWDEDTIAMVAEARAEGLCLRVDAASPLALDALARSAVPVIVWTVNEPERIRELLLAGVHGIITNTPGVAVEIARELGRYHPDPWNAV
jgi:glycerophosphoryl diester phosphodiesterase